jgi:hypothetical protein
VDLFFKSRIYITEVSITHQQTKAISDKLLIDIDSDQIGLLERFKRE